MRIGREDRWERRQERKEAKGKEDKKEAKGKERRAAKLQAKVDKAKNPRKVARLEKRIAKLGGGEGGEGGGCGGAGGAGGGGGCGGGGCKLSGKSPIPSKLANPNQAQLAKVSPAIRTSAWNEWGAKTA